jgi:hypothetical protein
MAEDADRKLIRDVVRRGKAALKQRLVPAAAVAAWQNKVERVEEDFVEVRDYRDPFLMHMQSWMGADWLVLLDDAEQAAARTANSTTSDNQPPPANHATPFPPQVIREERSERELRKAEMEANKMQNLVDHEDEIYSR